MWFTSLRIHREQKLVVVARVRHSAVNSVHGLYRIHVADEFAQYPHAVERGLVLQQIVAAGARSHEVDSWEDALVAERSVELQLHVTRAFEFLENHFVHLAARVDEGRCDDGE